MTARVLLLNFDDEESAESFVRQLLDAQQSTHPANWGNVVTSIGLLTVASANMEAMVARPSRKVFCRCRVVKPNESYKSERFGWWVHRTKPDGTPCNKPSWWAVRDFIKNMLNGHSDLLPELLARLEKEEPVRPDAEVVPIATPARETSDELAEQLRKFIPVTTSDPPPPDESLMRDRSEEPDYSERAEEKPTLRSWPIKSSSSDKIWDVTEIEGRLVCPCPPYLYKGQCPHVAAAETLRAEEDSGGDDG